MEKIQEAVRLDQRHMLNLRDLDITEIHRILKRAAEFKAGAKAQFPGKVVANLFFEPSTRTHQSFLMAEKRLGMEELNLIPEISSLQKGESLYDTVKTFEAIGADAVVIRAKEDRYYEELIGRISIPVLNGGDGSGDHPTQSLLDLLTIQEEFGRFKDLKILIVGDIRHSRVAATNVEVMRRLGMTVCLSAPEEFKRSGVGYCSLDGVLQGMDIVMLLRVQHERHENAFDQDSVAYNRQFGLNRDRVETMQKHAIIMHPAPFNRGWEITSDVVECSRSRIFKQMENGVYVRMAVLERALR